MSKCPTEHSFYNSWLRKVSHKERNILSLPMQGQWELQSVLDKTLKYVQSMNSTRVRILIEKSAGRISISVSDSKEMFMSRKTNQEELI